LIDPLDGTKEFVKKNGEFTVNVALIHRNEPVLGAVAVPVSGDLYFASKERGAFLRRNGTIYRLEQRAPADLGRSGLRVVASRSHMNEETHAFISTLKDPTLISVGSSLKFMAVATGEADLYPRFIPCMEWDTAAADIILREVGLGIIDNTSGNPLLYNKQTLLTNYFVCGGVAFSKT
jgi:3'(2'), 5'-bisphosphate nucleotidase